MMRSFQVLKGIARRRSRDRHSLRASTLFTAIILCTVFLMRTTALASDKSFDHPLIEIRIELESDGSALIEETRSFRFNGRFSWAELEKKTRGQYGQYGIEFLEVIDADTGSRLDMETSSTGYSSTVKWHYTAKDEIRRFSIRYRVDDAVQRYGDVAQFYWKAITDSHEFIRQVKIDLIPPYPSTSLFKVFVHSSARPGTLDITPGRDRATVIQSSIRRNTFVEVRALMDPAIFPGADPLQGESHESLLEDERETTERWRIAEQRRIERYRNRQKQARTALIVGSVFMALFTVAYIMVFIRFGREPETSYEGIYEREPPMNIKPCIVPAILSQSGVQVTEMGKSFAAALIESARLGYIEISEREEKVLMFKNRILVYTITDKGRDLLSTGKVKAVRDGALIEFEYDVLETVIREAGDGREATSKEIEEWAKKASGAKTSYYKFIDKKAKTLRKDFERDHFRLDDQESEDAKKKFMIFSFLAGTAFAIVSFLLTRHPLYLPFGILPAVAGLILAIPLARRTREAAINHQRWNAFKRFMSDFSAMKEAGPSLIPLWEQYLVFAVALGVADKLLSNMKLLAAETGTRVPMVAWFHPLTAAGSPGTGSLDGLGSIESLSASISNLNNLSTALSSSSSGGGGFSGGGGGGGGGGGCSAG